MVPFCGLRFVAVDSFLRIAILRLVSREVRCVPGSLLVLGGSLRFSALCVVRVRLKPIRNNPHSFRVSRPAFVSICCRMVLVRSL